MSSLSKKTKSSSNNTSTSELTDWSKGQFTSGQDKIRGVVNDFLAQPYKPFDGPLVADLSEDELRARELARASEGQNLGLFSAAEDAIRRGASTDLSATQVAGPTAVQSTDVAGPRDVNYRTFDADRVRARYNPYERDVVDAIGTYIDEDRTRQINDNQLRAAGSGAYGGSRHGVADAELMRTASNDKARVMSDYRYRGWNDAVAGDERESGMIYNADRANSDNDYTARRDNAVRGDATNMRNSDVDYAARRDNALRTDAAAESNRDNQYKSAGLFTDLASQKTAELNNSIGLMTKLGATAREIAQAKMLAEKAQYDEQYADAWRRFQTKLQTEVGLFGSTPMLTTNKSSGTSTTKTSDPMGEFSSFASGVSGLFGGIGKLFPPTPPAGAGGAT